MRVRADADECAAQCRKFILEEKCCTTTFCELPKSKLRVRAEVGDDIKPEDYQPGGELYEYLGLDGALVERSDEGEHGLIEKRQNFEACCALAKGIGQASNHCPKFIIGGVLFSAG